MTACVRPRTGIRNHKGQIVKMKPIQHPFSPGPVTVACGKCVTCRLEAAKQWAVRAVHEAQTHKHNCFITLTHNNESLPPDLSISVRTWQLFAKRLRKQIGPFRFLACGEYGDRNLRPHYHALIFGWDPPDKEFWQKGKRDSDIYYTSKALEKAWSVNGQQLGFCTVGKLNWETARYVARYVLKKTDGQKGHFENFRCDYDTGECWEVPGPFAIMSRRPGLGSDWFQRYYKDVYPHDACVIEGHKVRPPRFYDSLLERKDPSLMESVRDARAEAAETFKDDLTPRRLEAKEIFARASLTRNPRQL